MGDGFKTWSTGDVVTAAEFNGYLMEQAVMYFASAAARDSAVTSPEEGMHAYLADTDTWTFYDGSSWGAVSEQMASELTLADLSNVGSDPTTKGDLLVHNGTNVVRVGVGTNDQVLVANSGASAGVSWGAGAHIEGKATAGSAAEESVTWTDTFSGTPIVTTSAEDTAVNSAVISRSTSGATVKSTNSSGTNTSSVKTVMAVEAT